MVFMGKIWGNSSITGGFKVSMGTSSRNEGFASVPCLIYPLVNIQKAIENGHL